MPLMRWQNAENSYRHRRGWAVLVYLRLRFSNPVREGGPKRRNVMWTRTVVSLVLAPVAFFGTVTAQDQPKPMLRNSVMKATSPASGKQMFSAYCAVCHGEDGKGRGPAASALKKAPADLTRLSKNNKGKYPWAKVNSTILGTSSKAKHEMPEWGPLFRSVSEGHDSEVSQRVTNLTEYVKRLQAN